MSATAARTGRDQRAIGRVLTNLALLLVLLAFGGPFLWIVAAAIDRAPTTHLPWPQEPSLANIRELFAEREVGRPLRNSLIVATATMLLATAAAALAGYGLSRLRFRGKTGLAYGLLLLQTFPLAVTMVPIYDLAVSLRLQNTYQGLVLTHAALSLPLLVWLMKGFFDAVPRDLEEAAWLDGASAVRTWWQIVLPLTLPGLAVAAGFAFATAWAEVLMVVILVFDDAYKTIPFLYFDVATGGDDSGVAAALALLYVLPVLLVFLVLRKLMVKGLVQGSTVG